MTTNCLVEPRKSYKDRLFTVNAVSWPGERLRAVGGIYLGTRFFQSPFARPTLV